MAEPLTLSVVIPAHNEEGSLESTVAALVGTLAAAGVPYEVVVVDDHSTDGTARVLEELVRVHPGVRSVANDGPNGYGYAVRKGLESFSGDAVCVVMADASEDPRDVVTYYGELLRGYDCVFGSRFIAGGGVQNYPFHKLWINRLANAFIRLLFGFRYNDVTNAFKCYRRDVVTALAPILACHFNLTVEMPLKAIVRGFSYSVVPIRWYGRERGISKLRIREMGSRYLFIVLYVFLERWLSQGDYRPRRMVPGTGDGPNGGASAKTTAGPKAAMGRWGLLVFALIVLVRVAFGVTYPLNDKGGDTDNYWTMMATGKSNLVHAGGYPLLVGAAFRTGAGRRFLSSHPQRARVLILASQHLLDLAAVWLLFVVLRQVYGIAAACIAALVCGVDLQGMGATSAVYPEWLQAGLLVGALAAAFYAGRDSRWAAKVRYCSLALILFTGCVLVKFNAAVVGLVFLLLVLVDRTPVRMKVRGVGLAAIPAVAALVAYIAFYHYPSTGTWHLTHDRSWVLVAKLHEVVGNDVSPADGISTKRWLAFSSVLPQNFMDVAGLGMFNRIDAVPAETRRPYREKYLRIMSADDAWLSKFLGDHPLPPGFALNLSSVPISYFIGLPESDELGVGMFREVVSSRPGLFFGRGLRDFMAALYKGPDYHYPLVPTTANMESLGIRASPGVRPGFVSLGLPEDPWHWPFSYSRPVVWWPGLKAFSRWPDHVLPAPIAAGAAALALAGALVRIRRERRMDIQSGLVIVLTALTALVVATSCAVLVFRWKEARLLLPVTSALSGIGLGWGLREIWRVLFRSAPSPQGPG